MPGLIRDHSMVVCGLRVRRETIRSANRCQRARSVRVDERNAIVEPRLVVWVQLAATPSDETEQGIGSGPFAEIGHANRGIQRRHDERRIQVSGAHEQRQRARIVSGSIPVHSSIEREICIVGRWSNVVRDERSEPVVVVRSEPSHDTRAQFVHAANRIIRWRGNIRDRSRHPRAPSIGYGDAKVQPVPHPIQPAIHYGHGAGLLR